MSTGEYDDNLYGTPRPPKEPLRSPPPGQGNGSTLGSPTGLLPASSRGPSVDEDEAEPNASRLSLNDASPIRDGGGGLHPSSEGKRRRNRSNVEAVNPSADTPVNLPDDDVVDDADVVVGRPPSAEGVIDPSNAFDETQQQDEDRGPDGRGPLPANWEIATTPDGQVYFIDHNTDTTHWEDPRQPISEPAFVGGGEADLEQLPHGWERVDDPRFGVYYIDHVNRSVDRVRTVWRQSLISFIRWQLYRDENIFLRKSRSDYKL